MEKITKETSLAEILEFQGTQEILAKYNLPCLSCPMARFEIEKLTLGQICQMYQIETGKLLRELNEKIKKK